MTATSAIQRNLRRSRQEVPTHLFAVGQAVRLKDGFQRPVMAADIYRITATLPPRGESLQYRIRKDDERHERVATQDSLEAVTSLAEGNVMEKTFGNTLAIDK